jgi:hypothetical protein
MAQKNASRRQKSGNRIYCRGLENYLNYLKIILISTEPGKPSNISIAVTSVTASLLFFFTSLKFRLLDRSY